ncbi:hypothetical protein E2C01_000010 [Portunus trituberculatus]|uniref:Uncharacterized protein n=1 Tax=Portunus trituberculatus TaxID=210409 RepID=A0A5B7CDX8_PORTR|nr:hypothetical protein [Portunus trituberculatus]
MLHLLLVTSGHRLPPVVVPHHMPILEGIILDRDVLVTIITVNFIEPKLLVVLTEWHWHCDNNVVVVNKILPGVLPGHHCQVMPTA